MLHPICETSIPQAVPGAARIWGAGATSSFNMKVCVDGTDTLFFRANAQAIQQLLMMSLLVMSPLVMSPVCC